MCSLFFLGPETTATFCARSGQTRAQVRLIDSQNLKSEPYQFPAGGPVRFPSS